MHTEALIEELRNRGITSCGAMMSKDGETLMNGYDCNVLAWDGNGTAEQRVETVSFLFNYVIGKVVDSGELTEEEIHDIVKRW